MDNANESSPSAENYPLPEGTSVLNHQVAGHVHGKSKTKLGMLKHTNGCILKPVLEDKRGECELNFYETIFSADHNDPSMLELRKLLPLYFGTWETSINGKRVKYICLEDITDRFSKPSVLDIKIGPQTHDPEATPEKIHLETTKYPAAKIIGFRILGMRFYRSSTNESVVYGYDFGRKQTPDSILNALGSFFDSSSQHYCKHIINSFLNKLRSVHQWFANQRTFAFYSSSLLFVYESDESRWKQNLDMNAEVDAFLGNVPLELHTSRREQAENIASEMGGNIKCLAMENEPHDCFCDLRMIDFCHVYPSSDIDSNYIFGLERLIGYLEQLLDQAV